MKTTSGLEITIERVNEVTEEVRAATDRLMNSMPYSVGAARTIESLQLVSANPDAYWFVARTGRERTIVGMVFLVIYQGLSNRRSMVENLAVDPEYRRQGIAHALMEQVVRGGRGLGFKNLRVVTELDGPAAKLMDRMGFMHYDEMRLYERAVDTPLADEG